MNGVLEVVPEEAEIVKQIYHMYLYEGKGSSVIAHELSDKGIPTLKNRVWSAQHVLKLLKNEKYVGDLTQWKVYKPNVLAEKTVINHGDNPDVPLITIHDHHEAIVSREEWNAVQAELKKRSALSLEGRKHFGSFWLSGKVSCGKCGYTYVSCGSTKQAVVQMCCRNRMLYGKEQKYAPNGELIGCNAHSVDERIVAKAMDTIISNLGGISDTLETQLIDDIKKVQSMQTEFDPVPLKDEIAKYKTKKQKAIDLMLDELITKDDLKKQTAFDDSEIVRLTEKIAKCSNIAAQQNAQLDEKKGIDGNLQSDWRFSVKSAVKSG